MSIIYEDSQPGKVFEIELVDWVDERPWRFRFAVRIPAIGLVVHDFYWTRLASGVFKVAGPVVRFHVGGKNVKSWRKLMDFEGPNGARLLGAIGLACEKQMAAGG